MNTIKTILLPVVAAWTMSACQDWLSIYPTDRIVEENFWEDKNDLEGVRYAVYSQMRSNLNKMAMWGDIRSDSYELNTSDQSGASDKKFITRCFEGQLERDTTESFYDWSGFYRAINYCNKVLQHGPEVLANDKQFTSAEWSYIRAEITGLRALNYFYLIRAFKDVPYSTSVVNNDTEVMYLRPTNQLVILDSLILDVEQVEGQARNRFGSNEDTKGLMTNPAIYALLSDMYLWRASLHQGRGYLNDDVVVNNIPSKLGTIVSHTVAGDYQKCIDYADKAIDALNTQNENNPTKVTYGMSKPLENQLEDVPGKGYPKCKLYKNDWNNFYNGGIPMLWAKVMLFEEGNSDESIFELQFNAADNVKNDMVTSQWGRNTYTHLAACDAAIDKIYSNNGADRQRDSRMWFSAWNRIGSENQGSIYFCLKWVELEYLHDVGENATCQASKVRTFMSPSSDNDYRNWIIYRLSDVMLQRAEAMAMLGDGEEALRFVNTIHRRWYCDDQKQGEPLESVKGDDGKIFRDPTKQATRGNVPVPSVGTPAEQYEIAVLNERQLEFLGEGKRWFDLVRYAERHNDGGTVGRDAEGNIDSNADIREWTDETPINNGKRGVEIMVDNFIKNKYSSIYTTIKNRLKNRYGLYNPIYYKEISANTKDGVMYVEQNPVWNTAKYEK